MGIIFIPAIPKLARQYRAVMGTSKYPDQHNDDDGEHQSYCR
jgi:hypothetical protein